LRKSCIPAMPWTTVQKMIGAITMRIAAMNTSPNGFIAVAMPGAKCPSNAPITMATST
jgi:hypothetical protein